MQSQERQHYNFTGYKEMIHKEIKELNFKRHSHAQVNITVFFP